MNYINDLKNNICTVVFTKVNGETRRMRCTLKEDLLPAQETKHLDHATQQKRQTGENLVSVWDLDNDGWRSFRKDSVVDFIVNDAA